AACSIDPQHRSWRQLRHPLKECAVVLVEGLVAIDEIAVEVTAVDVQAPAEQRDDELGLGAEVEPADIAVQAQGLLAEAVATERQRTVRFVVDGECPHSLAPI